MNRLGYITLAMLVALLTWAGCSTDKQCGDACTIWESECGYTDYTYSDCFAECKADGDWGSVYLSCLRAADSCAGVEACDVL